MKIYKNEKGQLVIDGEMKVTVDITGLDNAQDAIDYDEGALGPPLLVTGFIFKRNDEPQKPEEFLKQYKWH